MKKGRIDVKKILLVIAVVLALVCAILVLQASAEDVKPVTVTLDGNVVDCESYGQPATIVEGRTLVPLRAIFEALGAVVEWDNATRTVTSTLDETTISLAIGKTELVKNGETFILDVPAMIMNDRTLVPVRAVSESFGVFVDWDAEQRIVFLVTHPENEETQTPSETPDEPETPKPTPEKDKDNSGTSSGQGNAGEKDTAKDENGESSLDGEHIYGDFYYGMSMDECKKLIDASSVEVGSDTIFVTDDDDEWKFEDESITGDLNFNSITLEFDGGLKRFSASTEFVSDSAPLMKALIRAAMYYGDDSVYDAQNHSYTWTRNGEKIVCSIERRENKTYSLTVEIGKTE